MRYLESRFSVGSPGTKAYADAWERTFGKQAEKLDVPSESACAPTGDDRAPQPTSADASEDVSVEVTAGCEAPGGSWQGAGGEGEVTNSPPPSSQTEGGVSGFSSGGTR